jgi:hypothetical protein
LRSEILKSGWHENIKIFIAKGVQADISRQRNIGGYFYYAHDTITDPAMGG